MISTKEMSNAWCMPGAEYGKQVLLGVITASSTWYVYVLQRLQGLK